MNSTMSSRIQMLLMKPQRRETAPPTSEPMSPFPDAAWARM
jgi:hypothetical protein